MLPQNALTLVCFGVTDVLTSHPFNNVTENIFGKIGANLHLRPDHPLCILKEAIHSYLDSLHEWQKFEDLRPVVTTRAVSIKFSSQQQQHDKC